ncbi:hypothetical protein Q5752_001424 [Cryptotrichosporon argae]
MGDIKAATDDEALARQLHEQLNGSAQLDADAQRLDEAMARRLQQDDTGLLTHRNPPPTDGDQTAVFSNNAKSTLSDHEADTGKPPPVDCVPLYVKEGQSAGSSSTLSARHPPHSNQVTEAAKVRAVTEQDMQNWLQRIQYENGIYNAEIEPEHETDYPCGCPICSYQMMKWRRAPVQDAWNAAVLYPGEKAYNANKRYSSGLFTNPYVRGTISPYWGSWSGSWGAKQVNPASHAQWIKQTIKLNNSLNQAAQAAIDAREPKTDIWGGAHGEPESREGDVKRTSGSKVAGDVKGGGATPLDTSGQPKPSRLSSFRKSIGLKSSDERQATRELKAVGTGRALRESIEREERGRWPDAQSRAIVHIYQNKTGMASKIADLRLRRPIQYLHLLRAGYFEPIPTAYADSASNPLKFKIEAVEGWRGITPAWRGFEDTAEERLYWVLNHREGANSARLKPDFISALDLARQRMAQAVPPPPEYYDAHDTCHVEHMTDGYSKQVMPAPFRATDGPETAADDTMILLDVSGSMDFVPQRPRYDRYVIKGFDKSPQPKNRDLAKAIVRRFVNAMVNHDHTAGGYDLTTFSSHARYVGAVTHRNFDERWRSITFGGGTRVMTGWQKVKALHFEKHSASAVHHPVYGWQAGPDTPILRLLLLLDGEATDMDEFELDLLGLSWAHVTIFLIGVDGCPHHHRHANELQRISDVNPHVAFVDAQGNTPERFVTHELLKRHLGYDVTMQQFEEMEMPPTYQEATR